MTLPIRPLWESAENVLAGEKLALVWAPSPFEMTFNSYSSAFTDTSAGTAYYPITVCSVPSSSSTWTVWKAQ